MGGLTPGPPESGDPGDPDPSEREPSDGESSDGGPSERPSPAPTPFASGVLSPRIAWVVIAVIAVVVNLPMASHVLTQRNLARSGIEVAATLVDSAQFGEGDAATYSVAFRFAEALDPRQTVWSSRVDRASYQRALDTRTVGVRVLPDRPEAFVVDGALTSHVASFLTAAVDGVLVGVSLALWGARRRARAGTDLPE